MDCLWLPVLNLFTAKPLTIKDCQRTLMLSTQHATTEAHNITG